MKTVIRGNKHGRKGKLTKEEGEYLLAIARKTLRQGSLTAIFRLKRRMIMKNTLKDEAPL
jgi:hypothetical protein